MSQQPPWAGIIGRLRRSLTYTSPRFHLFHPWRTPARGRGQGVEGVRDRRLLETCVPALEETWRVLGSAPHSRPLPADGDGRPQVYVFSVEDWPPQCPSMDHLFVRRRGENLARLLPVVALPSRSRLATFEDEMRSLRATIAHEITHVFNDVQRPRRVFLGGQDRAWALADRWLWLDEAIAVFMEMELWPDIREWLCFAMNWVDRPEVSLDAEGAEYEAGLFIRYLVQRSGERGLPTRLWSPSPSAQPDPANGKLFCSDLPLEALQEFFQAQGEVFCSAAPNVPDVFASGYCMDAYFLSDPNSACFMPDVHERYRNRAITEIVELRSGQTVEIADQSLNQLACRYYRLRPKSSFNMLNIEVRSAAASKLKAEVALATRIADEDFRKLGTAIAFQAHPDRLTWRIGGAQPEELDHLVLVVTNCGLRGEEDYPGDHDDHVSFWIGIEVG